MGYKFKKPSFLSIIIVLILLVALIAQKNIKRWKDPMHVIAWDVVEYYAYVPAFFIYHDISLEFANNYTGNHKIIFWGKTLPSGKRVIKTSMGMAICYTPFFAIGHISALLSNDDAGGFSIPYKFWLMMGGVFYFALGLYYLKKLLQLYFSDLVTAITLISVTVATNLYFYVIDYPAMTHSYTFTFSVILCYFTIKWHEKPSFKYSIIIGLLLGLISLIRPVNAIFVLFFVLFQVYNYKTFLEKIKMLFANYKYLIAIAFFTILVWIPQFWYWKYTTGSFWFYSYGNERFFFDSPQILKGLFGFRNGWLLYTPIMSFSIFGLYFLARKHKDFFFPITLIIIVVTYVILSWWCWWYTGFGHRAFIDFYGILAIPFAAFVAWFINNKNKMVKIGFSSLFVLLIMHGIFTNFQYHYQTVHYNSMTKESYIESFGKVHPTEKSKKLLKAPDYERAVLGLDRE